MKKIIYIFSLLSSLFGQYTIEGRWHLVGYEESVMYQFVDTELFADAGFKYTIYSIDGNFDDLEGDNTGGTPNPYHIADDIITIDYHFGNIVSYQINYRCDGEVVEFIYTPNGITHSILFREGYSFINNNCEETGSLECIEMDEIECNIDDGCEWVENIELESCNYINNQQECNAVGCSWYNGSYYACTICCWGEYEVDNSFCEQTEYQLGDLNEDSAVNILDIIIVMNLILNEEFNLVADINTDTTVNVLDIIELVNIILNS